MRTDETVRGIHTIYIVVSDHPQIRAIIGGTQGPYGGVPPWGIDAPLGGWADRHGFVTNRSRYMLARRIAVHGTKPAGTSTGKADWIREATEEAAR